MKDFNLKKFLVDNPLTKTTLKRGQIKEAFEGFGGVSGIDAIGDGAPSQMKDDEEDRPNKWISDIDRMPSINGWSVSWEHPGILAWSHPSVPTAIVVATPGWDGPGTPIEFQSDAGSMQMLNVLDQDEFSSFKEYAAAIKPYLDMVLKANTEFSDSETSQDEFQGIHETNYFDRRKSRKSMIASKGRQYDDDMEERIMGLGGDKLIDTAQFLIDDGFEVEDIIQFLRNNLS